MNTMIYKKANVQFKTHTIIYKMANVRTNISPQKYHTKAIKIEFPGEN